MTADVATPVTFIQPKVVAKAFTLPLVTDTYAYLAATSAPLQPYMDTAVAAVSPVVETSIATLKDTLAQHAEKVPEVVKVKVAAATEQAATYAAAADAGLCSGLDQLVAKVPALKEATPALYTSTLAATTATATSVATYIASFTLAQVVLKASDTGLELSDSLLKLVPGDKAVPIVEGLKRVRAEAAVVRKEGAKQNGTSKVLALEEATLLEAVLEVLGVTKLATLAADLLGITITGTTEAKEVATKDVKKEVTVQDAKKEVVTKETKAETVKTVTEGKTAKK